MELISSRSNPRLKLARSLRGRKARAEQRLYLAEGIRHVGQAVEAGAQIEFILYAPERLTSDYARELLAQAAGSGTQCLAVSAGAFDSLAEKDNPQGILAVIHQPETGLADLRPDDHPWLVGLVDPQDPGNVGAILRTIDAVAANGLLLLSSGQLESEERQEGGSTGIVDPYHPTCVRASLGAIFWKPVVVAPFNAFAAWAKGQGYTLVGSSARLGQEYVEVREYPRRCVLLLGSEREGLTGEQIGQCDLLVRLPMFGRGSSLNLAVAAGVLLYDQLSKRSPSGAP